MKKIISILFIALFMVGCSTKEIVKEVAPTTTEVKEVKEVSKTDDLGKGTIEIITESGSSKGSIPFVYAEKDSEYPMQITFGAADFNGKNLSYIYVDGKLNLKDQLSDTQMGFDIKDKELSEGKHKVEVKQFDTDKEDGKMITYKTAQYEVKIK